MDPKLVMLYLLIGTIIGLSDEGNVAKMKRGLNRPCWRIRALAFWWWSATKP